MFTEKLFKLSPIAEPGDPNWELLPNRGTVWVSARSSGEARAKAAEWENRQGDHIEPEHVNAGYTSAFADPGLYAVSQIDTDAGDHDIIS